MIDLPESELRERLTTALSVQRWVDEVAAAAPFDDVDALVGAATAAGSPLSEAEVDEAMAHHPRIGEAPTGEGAAQEFSRREQEASAQTDDPQLAEALAEGNARYEERFGRVFLIRAAGRSRAEIVGELERRLELDDETEKQVVGEQLVEIAVLRLRQMFAPTSAETSRKAETSRTSETASPREPAA